MISDALQDGNDFQLPSLFDTDPLPCPVRQSPHGKTSGTLTIAEGVDLTQPADPEWDETAYGDWPTCRPTSSLLRRFFLEHRLAILRIASWRQPPVNTVIA